MIRFGEGLEMMEDREGKTKVDLQLSFPVDDSWESIDRIDSQSAGRIN